MPEQTRRVTQPPYPPQPTPYAGPPPPPRRPRPRKVWFFVGGGLMVLAFVVFVGTLILTFGRFTQDAVFAAGETPVEVDLPAGTERALYSNSGFSVDCTATDGTGANVEFRPVSGEFTFNQWTAVSRFDTGDGHLTFDCVETSPGTQLRIGALPSAGGFLAAVAVGILLPMALGLIGLMILIVTTALWATGAPRGAAGTT
jgi:hypothetical protein